MGICDNSLCAVTMYLDLVSNFLCGRIMIYVMNTQKGISQYGNVSHGVVFKTVGRKIFPLMIFISVRSLFLVITSCLSLFILDYNPEICMQIATIVLPVFAISNQF